MQVCGDAAAINTPANAPRAVENEPTRLLSFVFLEGYRETQHTLGRHDAVFTSTVTAIRIVNLDESNAGTAGGIPPGP